MGFQSHILLLIFPVIVLFASASQIHIIIVKDQTHQNTYRKKTIFFTKAKTEETSKQKELSSLELLLNNFQHICRSPGIGCHRQ